MRVITGTARGTKLKTPEGMLTRPTTDRVKEALFNIIQFDIAGDVLDLFAGTVSSASRRSAAEPRAPFLSTTGRMPLPSCTRICAARILKTGERSCARISHSILRGAGGNSA